MDSTHDLHISCIQAPVKWEDKEGNLDAFESLIDSIGSPCDLILLPEVFNTGFSMNPVMLAEPPDGDTFRWMQRISTSKRAVIAGTMMVSEGDRFYNRLIWVYPDGTSGFYDKRHLFRMGSEVEHFSSGSGKDIFSVRGWKIMPLVCYDLRFPVWSMNSRSEDGYHYDLLVYLANWPSPRRHHWRQLLVARAIENQAVVAGVNRTGTDGNGIRHSGYTMIIDSYGKIVAEALDAPVAVVNATLSRKELDDYRLRFPVANDWENSFL